MIPEKNLLNDKSCRNATEEAATTQAPVSTALTFRGRFLQGWNSDCRASVLTTGPLLMVTESHSCLYMQVTHQG